MTMNEGERESLTHAFLVFQLRRQGGSKRKFKESNRLVILKLF